MITPHLHAELISEYAKDAMQSDEPWKIWEYWDHGSSDVWKACTHHPEWREGTSYRRMAGADSDTPDTDSHEEFLGDGTCSAFGYVRSEFVRELERDRDNLRVISAIFDNIDSIIDIMEPKRIRGAVVDGNVWSVWLPSEGRTRRPSLRQAIFDYVDQTDSCHYSI